MKNLIFPIGLLLVAGPVLAQLNETDTLRWRGKLSISGSYLNGIERWVLLINRVDVANANPAWL